MNFTFMFRVFPWLMITPWTLYSVSLFLIMSTVWEKGRKERFLASLVLVAAATFILAVMIWPSSMGEMAEIIKANYFFPNGKNGHTP